MTNEQAIAELEHILELESIALGRPTTSRRGYAVRMAIEALKQPEPKKGEWIVKIEGPNLDRVEVLCSICGYNTSFYQFFDYCPKCGAQMEEKK